MNAFDRDRRDHLDRDARPGAHGPGRGVDGGRGGAPSSSPFVFAYTNADVDALNADLRAVRRERGELGEDVAFDTKHGQATFAVGDRVQFTDTLRGAKIYNGNAGVITGIDGQTGDIRAQLDAVGGAGSRGGLVGGGFEGFRHGYAGTIYKGQGKTLDRTYLYHSAALAGVGVLCGADPPARERAGLRRHGDGARRGSPGPADGPRRGARGLGGLGHAGGSGERAGRPRG